MLMFKKSLQRSESLGRRITTGCLTCDYFKHSYFSAINKAAAIIESEEFIQLPEHSKDFLLNALEWENHKDFALSHDDYPLSTMCNWWDEINFQGTILQTFTKIASIQTAIQKKKGAIESAKAKDSEVVC